MIKVAVTGAAGRMGQTVCQAVNDAPDMQLVARLDVEDPITAQSLAGAQVAVDFTQPGVTQANVQALLTAGLHVVVGTTGWDDDAFARVQEHLAKLPGQNQGVIIAPNFSLSAVLAMSFAAKAAAHFASVEVIEMHHPNKLDAPSGTAITTAKAIAKAREAAQCPPMTDATETDPLGARGAKIAGVPVHAVRLTGLVAHEEILLGNSGEQLVIRTDCFDRISFMPGVLLAIRKVGQMPGLMVGLEQLLDL